jgi:hypothetical protein
MDLNVNKGILKLFLCLFTIFGSRGLFVGRGSAGRGMGGLLIPAIAIGGGLAIGLTLAKKL